LKIIQKQKEEISYLTILSQTQDNRKSKKKNPSISQNLIFQEERREEISVEKRREEDATEVRAEVNPAEEREEGVLVTRKKSKRNFQPKISNSKLISKPIIDSTEYEIEKILDYKARKENNEVRSYYLVKWENYGEESNSWEPAENLGNASMKIQAFIEMKRKEAAKNTLLR
jgi:hypothetical protein